MIARLLCWLRAFPGACRERLSGTTYPGARAAVFAALLAVGLVCLNRPHLPQLLPGYARFDDLMPFAYWGWAALLLALLMLVTRPGSLPALAVNFWVSVYLFAVGFAVMAGVGLTPAASAYLVLGSAALLLFGSDFRGWFPKIGWVQRLSSHPPRFIRKWFDDRA